MQRSTNRLRINQLCRSTREQHHNFEFLANALCFCFHDSVNVESTRFRLFLRSFRHILGSFLILAMALFRFLPFLPLPIPLRIDLARERAANPLALVSYA